MVLDYSKWDALELSDDSDIEVHPNVDKRSFIRAKQNQIHQQRFERRHHIETLKYERVVNDGLLERIDALLSSLRKHEKDAQSANGPDIFMMQALMESSGDPAKDEPPKPPEGVHTKEEQPSYSHMMASLVDQVKKEVGDKPDDWYTSYEKGIEGHRTKVLKLQEELATKLNELELEEGRKITSDSIHTGFDKSSVVKEKEKPKATPKAKAKKPGPAETVEVLNPGSVRPSNLLRTDSALSSGAEADVDEPLASNEAAASDSDEEHIEPSALGREFAHLKLGDYKASLRFISAHREIVTEREQDGLLMEAFTAEQDNNPAYAKQCVHQALLLQYCRSLGKDGVGLFFTRIQTPGHQAQKVFHEDVASTYGRIADRVAELAKQHASSADGAGGVEQIQLHAVEPGTQIHINIPQPGSSDQVEIDAREIFEGFPPGLQRALESGSLDRVNEVLGKMSVEEAEEVVAKLGDAGTLSSSSPPPFFFCLSILFHFPSSACFALLSSACASATIFGENNANAKGF